MFQSRNRGSGGGWEKGQTRLFLNVVIWKEQVVLFVGAASSRDHLISRLQAAPTGSFFIVT